MKLTRSENLKSSITKHPQRSASTCGLAPCEQVGTGFQLLFALATAAVVLLCVLVPSRLVADEVTMQNGDRYVGQVVSLDTNTLVLRSEVLGSVRLPRDKVTALVLDSTTSSNATPASLPKGATPRNATGAARNQPAAPLASPPPTSPDTNLVQQIQSQLLGSEGAEANAKFREMVGGYLSGRLTVNDIRAQAQSAAEQLRKLKGELGDSESSTLDGYLAILEKFLNEGSPPSGGATPAQPSHAPGSAPDGAAESE